MRERPIPTLWHETPLPHTSPLWNDSWCLTVVRGCNNITMLACQLQEVEHIRTLHSECWGTDASGMWTLLSFVCFPASNAREYRPWSCLGESLDQRTKPFSSNHGGCIHLRFLDAGFPQMIPKQRGDSAFFIEQQTWPASGAAGTGRWCQ